VVASCIVARCGGRSVWKRETLVVVAAAVDACGGGSVWHSARQVVAAAAAVAKVLATAAYCVAVMGLPNRLGLGTSSPLSSEFFTQKLGRIV